MNDDNIAPGTPDNVDAGEHVDDRSWQQIAGLDGNASFEKFDSVASLAKSYTELEKYNSGSMRIPSDDASDEARSAFYDKLSSVDGVIRTPEGYIPPPSEASGYHFSEVEGFAHDESTGELKTMAHDLGLTEVQADGIHKWLAGDTVKADADRIAANHAGMGELKGLWGNAYEQKMTAMENTINILSKDIPELKDAERTPGLVRLMDMVGQILGEAGPVQNDPRNTMTPDEASRRLAELNEKYSGVQEGDVGYDAYTDRRIELYQQGGKLMRDTRQEY